MKKFLSLVLALVMTFSLVTVSAGATEYTDNSAIKYGEAVDVISGLKIVDGYATGAFNPSNTLTRGAAAKIICNMVLGPTAAAALSCTSAPFSDVPANHTFAGYIEYCSSQGIINGYGDGTFKPAATVTGYQFLKMLLGALGYDATIEKFTGSNYTVNVAKLAVSLKLTKGNSAFVGSKALTREEACLYAFNTLKATMVDYATKGTNITVNGVTINQGASKAEKVTVEKDGNAYPGYKNTKADNDGYLQFCEKYFSDLKYVSTTSTADAYGRPAHKWYNGKVADKNLIGTYADEAVLSYTTGVKGTTLKDDVKDAGYEWAEEVNVIRNGGDAQDYTSELAAALKSTTKLGGNGIVLELFANSNDEIDKVVVIATYLGKVDSITKDKASTKSVDERALTLTYTDAAKNNLTIKAKAEDDVIGFNEVYDNVKKGDYVLFVPQGDNTKSEKVVAVAIPETATGAVTRTSTSSVTIGGTAYNIAKVVTNAPFGLTSKTATVYLDEYGYAIGYDGAASTGDKAVAVLKVYKTLNSDGELVDMIKGVTSNGETVTWEYENSTPEKNKVYTYTETDDVYTLTAVTGSTLADDATVSAGKVTLKTSSKSISFGGTKAYFDSDVKFIFVDGGKATVKDGVQKVSGYNAYATISKDGDTYYITALYVLGTTSSSSTTSDDLVFVVGKKNPDKIQVTVNGKDKEYKGYTAYINGEKVNDFYTSTTVNEGESDFYSVEKDDDSGAYVLTGNAYTTTTGKLAVSIDSEKITGFAGNIMSIGANDYDLANATIVDTTSNGNDIDSVSLLKDAKAAGDVNVKMIYNADSNAVEYVFVMSYTAF